MVQAIEHFNGMDLKIANFIQERIFQEPGKSCSDIFSQKELNQLQNKVEYLDLENLNNIVNAFSYILMQVVAERNFGDVLEQLQENSLSEEHSQIFQENWKKYGNSYSNKLREKPIAVGGTLQDFSWNIQVPIDDSKLPVKNVAIIKESEEKIDDNEELFSIDARNPEAIFNFKIQGGIEQNTQQKENFAVRATKLQIQELFENFEDIQSQLDRLSK